MARLFLLLRAGRPMNIVKVTRRFEEWLGRHTSLVKRDLRLKHQHMDPLHSLVKPSRNIELDHLCHLPSCDLRLPGREHRTPHPPTEPPPRCARLHAVEPQVVRQGWLSGIGGFPRARVPYSRGVPPV